jgi:transporter family protein
MALDWVIYAVLAQLLWSIAIIFDKLLRIKYIDNSYVLAIFFSIFYFLPLIFILPFINIGIPAFKELIILLLIGSTITLALLPYIKSLSLDDASRVIPLWQITPIFVLLMAFLFLKEKLTINNYIGFFLLLIGGFLISVKKIKGLFRISLVFWLMLLSSFIFAIGEVLIKYIYSSQSYWTVFFWILIGQLFSSLFLLFINSIRISFLNTLSKINRISFILLLGTSLGGFFGRLLYYLAIMLGSVSIVSVIGGLEGFFVLVYALFLSLWFPKILREEIDKRTILIKIIAIFLMVSGLLFVYL